MYTPIVLKTPTMRTNSLAHPQLSLKGCAVMCIKAPFSFSQAREEDKAITNSLGLSNR